MSRSRLFLIAWALLIAGLFCLVQQPMSRAWWQSVAQQSVAINPILNLSPSIWVESSDAANFTLSGSTVTQWNDISGNGHNLTSVSGKQPNRETVAGLGGLNAVKFDGTDDYLSSRTSWTVGQPLTLIAVHRTSASIADLEVIMEGDNTGGLRAVATLKFSVLSNKPHAFAGLVAARSNTVLSASTSYIDITLFNTTSSNTSLNGAAPDPTSFDPSTNGLLNGIGIGGPGEWADGLGAFSGWMAEYLVVPRALTGTEQTQVVAWLRTKWSCCT